MHTLVKDWLRQKLAVGTIKNRIAVLRWWAEKADRRNVVAGSNAYYGIPDRQFVTNASKAKEVDRHLDRQGGENWQAQVDALAAKITERNLPPALRGRNIEAIALMRHLQTLDLYDPVLDGLVSAFKYDKTYFDKIVSFVGPLMERLTTGNIVELISPDYLDKNDTRPIFEWMGVIRRKGIVYVGLDALTDTTVASAVGNSMFADLVSVAGHIYKRGVSGEAIDTPPQSSLFG